MTELPKKVTDLFGSSDALSLDFVLLRLEELTEELKLENDRELEDLNILNANNSKTKERITQLKAKHEEGELTISGVMDMLTEVMTMYTKTIILLNAQHTMRTIANYRRRRANEKIIDLHKRKQAS